jgi:uncharacterized protein YjbI with pentapeptide repeats
MAKLKDRWQKFLKETRFGRFLKSYAGYDDLAAIILIIIGGLYYWNNGPIPYHEGLHNFYDKIHIDLIGIGLTVLIISNAVEAVSIQAEKHKLILQMGSPINAFAVESLRQLAQNNWLYDGSLKGSNLIRANLEGAELGGAHLERAQLREAHLKRADLKGGHLEKANLTAAFLEGADLIGADLEGADLRYANLERAILMIVNLKGVDLREANLEGADLRDANLKGAKFNENTIWKDAICNTGPNNGTKWPDKNFDPEAKEMILTETSPISLTRSVDIKVKIPY